MSYRHKKQLAWRRFCVLSIMAALCMVGIAAHGQRPLIDPAVADAGGGARFWIPDLLGIPSFNGVRAVGVWQDSPSDCDPFEEPSDCGFLAGTYGYFPAVDFLGMATLTLQLEPGYGGGIGGFPEAVTFVDAALVDSMQPTAYSIGPDNRMVTLEGAGFPINRGVQVWVGDAQATEIEVDIYGEVLEFRPPPFPGGEYPLTVDVRVVTVGGGETVLEDAFTYDLLLPEFILNFNKRSAWKSGPNVHLSFKHVNCDEELEIYFDEELAFCGRLSQCRDTARWACILPIRPPGYVDVTVINPDGVSYTLEDGFRFTRSSPLHSADRNGDGVVGLSELLRVVQFYNEGGYRCAPEGVTTEDGFVSGPGVIPEDCRPHDSDLMDWDWQVDLSELLETIQLYNFGPYTLCEDEVFFCPAE